MVWRLLTLFVLMSGCNKLFDLEPVASGPIDAADDGGADGSNDLDVLMGGCTPIGFDEDHDGLDDACDPCPTVSSISVADADGDGLPDACDPSDTTADKIEHFWTFSSDTDLASLVVTPGVVRNDVGDGSVLLDASTSIATLQSFPARRIVVLVHGASPTATTGTLTVELPSVTACDIKAQACGMGTSSTCATVVPSLNSGATLGVPISSVREIRFYGVNSSVCEIASGTASVGATGTAAFVPSNIRLLTNSQLAINIDSIVVYGAK